MRIVISFFIIFFIPLTVSATLSLLKIHFIEVGQGDSILVETPTNKTILIDGGPPEAGKKVTTYLKENKIKSLDLVVSTHPHIDHIGGLHEVIKQFPIKKVLETGQHHSTKTYRNYNRLLKKHSIPIEIAKQNKEIDLDPLLQINILNSYEKGDTHNESAIVLHVTYNEKSFLLMSDVEKKQERAMIEKHELKSDVIKIGHHGSRTSSSLRFLQRVRPDVAMLTYDIENDYGHPATTVISNLHHLDVDVYSTATFGHTTIVTDGYNYLLRHERNPIENLLN